MLVSLDNMLDVLEGGNERSNACSSGRSGWAIRDVDRSELLKVGERPASTTLAMVKGSDLGIACHQVRQKLR